MKTRLQTIIKATLVAFTAILVSSTQAQSLMEIPSPTGFQSPGYAFKPFSFQGNLYAGYINETPGESYNILRYDGTDLTPIPNPVGLRSPNLNAAYVSTSVVYFQFVDINANNFVLVVYDGTDFTQISSPTGYTASGAGYVGQAIEFGSDLYFRYTADDNSSTLFKYDGTDLTEIPSPVGYENVGYVGSPIVFGSNLYLQYMTNGYEGVLFKYDGTTLTEIPNPSGFDGSNNGYLGYYNITIGSDLFMMYKSNSGVNTLMKYDGTSLTDYALPTGSSYNGDPVVYNSELYIKVANQTGRVLYKVTGNSLVEIPAPTGFTTYGYFGEPIVFGSMLYLKYAADAGYNQVLAFDGTTFTPVPNPTGLLDPGSGYDGLPIQVGNDLYLRYRYGAPNYNYVLMKYDGVSLTEIASPAGFTESGYSDFPIAVGSELFMQYENDSYTAKSLVKMVPASTVGVEETEASSFSIYPNPANDVITINTNGKEMNVTLFGMAGRTIINKNVTSDKYQMDVSNLATGMYAVRFETTDGNVETQRLMIQK